MLTSEFEFEKKIGKALCEEGLKLIATDPEHSEESLDMLCLPFRFKDFQASLGPQITASRQECIKHFSTR